MAQKELRGTPQNSFRFSVEIDGVTQMLVQKITGIGVSIENAEHGDGGFKVNTPTIGSYKDITMEGISMTTTTTPEFFALINRVLDTVTGQGGLYEDFIINATIAELGPNGQRLNVHEVEMYPFDWEAGDFDRVSSDNLIQKIQFKVNGLNKLRV